jgi:hypothetical protein
MNKALYFSHDDNARLDPKIVSMISHYKIEGYGRYWIILEYLRKTKGYKLEDKAYNWEALAELMLTKPEEVKKFVKDCVEKFELFVKKDSFYYSSSFLERMIKVEQISFVRAAAGKLSHKKEDDND